VIALPTLDKLSETSRNSILTLPVEVNDSSPFVRPKRELSRARLALVTSAGLHLRDDCPFSSGDPTFRRIPSTVTGADLLQSHTSLGFDRTAVLEDINVVFPIDRLREMVTEGKVGEFALTFYSLMGAQRDVSKIKEETGPIVADLLLADGVDLVLFTPTCPLCTRTVSTLARLFEERGLSTVAISLVREHTAKIKPPRAVFVPFPFGMPLGHPGNPAEQRAVLDLAFSSFEAEHGPVLLDFPDAERGDEPAAPIQASAINVEAAASELDFATEVTLMRRYWEQRHARIGRTGVGLSRVQPARFRGLVRFLEAYSTDQSLDAPERPDDMDKLLFIRSAVEDMRVLYAEARMETHPKESSEERQRWLLGATALGVFLRKLAAAMSASADPAIVAAVIGITR
jgi:D-proline reductase (dithiol) PrdB